MGKWFIATNGIIGGMQRIREPPVRPAPRFEKFRWSDPGQKSKCCWSWPGLVLNISNFSRTGWFWSVDPCEGYQCHRADVPFFDTKLRNCWFKLKVTTRPVPNSKSILIWQSLFVEPQHFQWHCSRCSFANQIEKFYEPVLPSDPVPTPDSPLCAKDRKCLTLNCPWKSYPDKRYKKYKHYECKTMDKGLF